jgi:2-methylisocitrate lyase-like PEP mutase family enzyme
MNPHAERAERFRHLHATGTFVIPNPWDAGTAHVLADLGFKALATTSAGHAFTLARPDNHNAVSRTETLANARQIVDATSLPVSADLENGFGDEPDDCAETIRAAGAIGLSGGSIEDATGRADVPIYDFDAAVARVRAAVHAARALPHDFVLVARAEGLLHKVHDIDEIIRRLTAYAEVGADCLYAPALADTAQITRVVRAVAPKPVNVLAASPASPTVAELAAIGVRRISVGSALARVAFTAFRKAAEDIANEGRFAAFAGQDSIVKINARFGSQ